MQYWAAANAHYAVLRQILTRIFSAFSIVYIVFILFFNHIYQNNIVLTTYLGHKTSIFLFLYDIYIKIS